MSLEMTSNGHLGESIEVVMQVLNSPYLLHFKQFVVKGLPEL